MKFSDEENIHDKMINGHRPANASIMCKKTSCCQLQHSICSVAAAQPIALAKMASEGACAKMEVKAT
jgi:hypothetical protein